MEENQVTGNPKPDPSPRAGNAETLLGVVTLHRTLSDAHDWHGKMYGAHRESDSTGSMEPHGSYVTNQPFRPHAPTPGRLERSSARNPG